MNTVVSFRWSAANAVVSRSKLKIQKARLGKQLFTAGTAALHEGRWVR